MYKIAHTPSEPRIPIGRSRCGLRASCAAVLPERGVGVGVGRSGDRDHRGELGVAQAGESTGRRGQQEGQHDARPRVLRRRQARQHEDAGADDVADAEHHQPRRPQHPLQRVLAAGTRLGPQAFDGLRHPQGIEQAASSWETRHHIRP